MVSFVMSGKRYQICEHIISLIFVLFLLLLKIRKLTICFKALEFTILYIKKSIIFKVYLDHIWLLADKDKKVYQYLLNYLAHLIQKPGERPVSCTSFYI